MNLPRAMALSGTIRVSHAPDGVVIGRRHIYRTLLRSGVDQSLADDVEVVVCELLGNSVRHARSLSDSTLALTWEITDTAVTMWVVDGGSRRNVEPADRPALSESGRGLRIVDRLAGTWGVTDSDSGRTVWARFTRS
jgi:anti-sigma regulatory factor (Ser/Thr protein kinase)